LSNPTLQRPLKIYMENEQISNILFLEGKRSSIRSRRLVLW